MLTSWMPKAQSPSDAVAQFIQQSTLHRAKLLDLDERTVAFQMQLETLGISAESAQAPQNKEFEASPAQDDMLPSQYAELFMARQAVPSETVRGLCGRFMRGTNPAEFEFLSDEPGKRLSWVCCDEMLAGALGKSPAEAMFHIGFRIDWLEDRLRDGTSHKLVVFPACASTVATWDNLFEMVGTEFGDDVLGLLTPHIQDMKTKAYYEIDPRGRFDVVTKLPVAEKYAHSEFLTAERLLSLERPISLYHARGFMYCAIGCNSKFTGTGLSPDGLKEFIMPNRRLTQIPGHVLLDLDVSQADLDALRLQYAN